MLGMMIDARAIRRATGWLAVMVLVSGTAFGQTGRRSKKKAGSKPVQRAKTSPADTTAADRIKFKGGDELLGQVEDSSPAGSLLVLARREWVRANLPGRAREWEAANESITAEAALQRRERLMVWRHQRPTQPMQGDRITAWLDRELVAPSKASDSTPLIAVRIAPNLVSSVQRRGEQAARTLRAAWLLGIADAETTPLATLVDTIAGRGMVLQGDEPIALDRVAPPGPETDDHWLLRRAATEALHDEGLRFIRFGSTILPEPIAGQQPDPAAGTAIAGGVIRDVLGVGSPDPLAERLRDIADRGRIGALITRIEVAPDLSAVSAESALYYHGAKGWARGPWRTGSLQVGAVPPAVVAAVARDPQVRGVMELVESIGGGLVSPEMKDRGLVMGTTAGGAVLLARTALISSLTGLALDLTEEASARRTGTKR